MKSGNIKFFKSQCLVFIEQKILNLSNVYTSIELVENIFAFFYVVTGEESKHIHRERGVD